MKTSVKTLLLLMIMLFIYGCSKNSDSKYDSNLIKIITYDDMDKMKFDKENIYIVPEIHEDHSGYYIQTKKSGLFIKVDNEGVIKTISLENETANNSYLRFAFTDEKEANFWRISDKKELTIKLNKDDNSDFEVIKSKIE